MNSSFMVHTPCSAPGGLGWWSGDSIFDIFLLKDTSSSHTHTLEEWRGCIGSRRKDVHFEHVNDHEG